MRAGTQQGSGSKAAGPPYTTAGGRGRAGRCRWAQATSGRLQSGERPSAREPPPHGWGRGGPEGRVGAAHGGARRRARTSVAFFFLFFFFSHFSARARALSCALCGPLVARSRPTCASPLALSCGPWARTASGARATPRPPGFAARALLLVAHAVRSARRTPLPRGGQTGGRASGLADDRPADWGRLRVGPLSS